jgi:hypothetical protein
MPTIEVANLKIHTEDLDDIHLEKVQKLEFLKHQLRDTKIELSIIKDAQNFYANHLSKMIK